MPLFRRESSSLRQLFICKFFVWLNCLVARVRYAHLRGIGSAKLQELSKNRAENVFVFANGPSLNELDFDKIKKLVDQKAFDLVTVNCFASEGICKFEIKPTIAVFGDPDHFIGPNGDEISPQFLKDIDAVNETNIPALVPNHYFSKSRFVNGIPYCSNRNQYGKNVSDIQKPLGFYSVTAFTAISVAIHLGYKNIFLCGYDNSYFREFAVDRENRRILQNRHFYDSAEAAKREMSAEEFGPISNIFLDFSRHFRYLEKISALKPLDVRISNIALTTYTDAFPRNFDLDIYHD